ILRTVYQISDLFGDLSGMAADLDSMSRRACRADDDNRALHERVRRAEQRAERFCRRRRRARR
ncbi:hypothetical protein HN937_18025, partial [Candidatus Poribacteria bacterium]|nr:hypothetical protein [Candidatus Poribacteria bacterium]